MHSARNAAQAKIPRSVVAQPLRGRSADCATEPVQDALAAFGVPTKRQHFVSSARSTSPSRTGRETAIANLASDEWRPTYPATRHLSDRAPFAHHLSGYDPDRVADADYSWSVP